LSRVFPHRNIAFSLDSGLAQHSIPKRRAKVEPNCIRISSNFSAQKKFETTRVYEEKSAECH
jgi:hypothetical protein